MNAKSTMTGKDLAETRKHVGLTQAAFAKKLHVSVSTIEAWEQGVNPIPLWVDDIIESWEEPT